jgi:hypothetical protein
MATNNTMFLMAAFIFDSRVSTSELLILKPMTNQRPTRAA